MEDVRDTGGQPTSFEAGWTGNVEWFEPDPRHEVPLSTPNYDPPGSGIGGSVGTHPPSQHRKHRPPHVSSTGNSLGYMPSPAYSLTPASAHGGVR